MITSTKNPQVKDLIKLKRKSSERRERGLFIAEGQRLFEEIPRELIRKIYVSESYVVKSGISEEENIPFGIKQRTDSGSDEEPRGSALCEVLSDEVFEYVSDTRAPQGILALVRMPEYNICDVLQASSGLFLLLDTIQDPGNLGTMIRTAAASGASGVFLLGNCADIYSPKTIRSTMGSIFKIPVIEAESQDVLETELHKRGAKIYAAALGGAECYTDVCFSGGSAIIIGNEGSGISDEVLKIADQRIYIPMHGGVESLNAAMAAGIILFEAARQRAKTPKRKR